MQRKIIKGAAGILAVVVLIWAADFTRPYVLKGSQIPGKMTAPAIPLKEANGIAFDLSGYKGKVVLIFFGYALYPDVSPTTMADFKRIKADLGEAASHVAFVFITVVPQRERLKQTQAYASGFDARFSGLSGSEADLQPVWTGYGVYRRLQDNGGHQDGSYEVDPSTRIYRIDEASDLRLTYPYATAVRDISSDIRYPQKERL